MADIRETQVAVIGGGPGGYPAAFAAADLGMKVTIVDADPKLGGVCLQRGCIPSKALLHVASLINETRESESHGIAFAPPAIDLAKLREFVHNGVIGKMAGGLVQLCKVRNVEWVRARATFEDSNTVRLEGENAGRLRFEKAVLAVGSVPAMPKAFAVGDDRVMDSTGALALADIPKKLLVIGGGYIGLEMGSVYAALGSQVTVVEFLDALLIAADRDLVTPLATRLKKQFAAIHLSTKVAALRPEKAGIVAVLEGPDKVQREETFDRVLVSVGRRPNSAGIGLDKTKVQLDEKGFVKVDAARRTTDPSIWAVGDVAGEPMLAHKATAEAKVAVESMHGERAEFKPMAIPAVVFTDPELAWAGLTENEAKAKEIPYEVHKFHWAASGRATSLGRTDGLTKLVVNPQTQRVLGVGIVGFGAGDLISEGVLAIEMGAVARDLADTIHPHPTLSESIMESAELALGSATHVVRAKRK